MVEDAPEEDAGRDEDAAQDESPVDAGGSTASDAIGQPVTGIPTHVQRLEGVWEDVVDDLEATAEEYREDGWEVVTVHPGDVAAPQGRDGGRWGLDVLVPDNEWADIEALVEDDGHDFDSVEVFHGQASGLMLLVVALRDEAGKAAILYPAYYGISEAEPMLERAVAEGSMQTHLRPLDERQIYTFVHEDLDLFLPNN